MGGNQRYKILKRRGVAEADAVVVDLDEIDEKALNVTLNNPNAQGRFDARIDELLASVRDARAELYERLRLQALVPGRAITETAAPPPVPAQPRTRPGDLIVLGGHRLLCADARDARAVARLFEHRVATVVVTSPPYAAQRDYDEQSGFEPIAPAKYVEWFAPAAEIIADHLAPDGSFFLNLKEHAEGGERSLYVKDLVITMKRAWGWLFVDEFVWTHGGTPQDVKRRFKNAFEPIYQFARSPDFKFRPESVRHRSEALPDWRGAHPSQANGQRLKKQSQKNAAGDDVFQGRARVVVDGLAYPSNVLRLGKNAESVEHGAVYPVALPEFFIRAYSDSADYVFDPFAGAGTTLIAAESNGRPSLNVEISPAYCDVIVKRWEAATGKKATRPKRRSGAA